MSSKLLKFIDKVCAGIVTFLCTQVYAQIPDTLWTKTYGSVLADQGVSVQVTSDEGYIIAGSTFIAGGGGHNYYLIKTDSLGDTVWTNTYGGPGYDCAQSVRQTDDGGYLVVGHSYSFGGVRSDAYIVKTDPLGVMQWDRVYGGAEDDAAADVVQTFDGGYIITGYTSSYGEGLEDLWLLRTDSLGDTTWTQTYGTIYCDYGASILQSTDSGFVVTGANGSGATSSLWVLKTDQDGLLQWSKIYSPGDIGSGSSIQQTMDGGFVIAGSSFAGAGESDFWLLRTDAQGDTIWTRAYGGAFSDDALSVRQTTEGGFISAGRTWSFGYGVEDLYVVRTDSLGDILWTWVHGGTYDDRASSVGLTSDRGYIIAGRTESFGAGDYDVWLLRIATDPFGIEDSGCEDCVFECIGICPNPFSKLTEISFSIEHPDRINNTSYGTDSAERIELKIYDVAGRRMRDLYYAMHYAPCAVQVSWDGADQAGRQLCSGVYFVRFEAGNHRTTEKVLLIK
jgi:hypothetical protein